MTIGLIGLGRMGQSIAARLQAGGYSVVGYDLFPPEKIDVAMDGQQASQKGSFTQVNSAQEVATQARVIWLMVPAGDPVDEVIGQIAPFLQKGSIIVDGGNSFFKDSIRRASQLAGQGFDFVDCGTSGGLQGRSIGFCLMVGGTKKAYAHCLPIFQVLAAPEGCAHVGPAGAGHYVKMIHNGIEYALLEAYAEGFQLLKEGFYKDLDLAQISGVWNHGSIIRSWILELSHDIFVKHDDQAAIAGSIQESGTGRWTVEEAKSSSVGVPLIEESLRIRAWSRQTGGNYATKLVALLRHAFGGHALIPIQQKEEGREND